MKCPFCGEDCRYESDGFGHEFGFEESGSDICPEHGDVTAIELDQFDDVEEAA